RHAQRQPGGKTAEFATSPDVRTATVRRYELVVEPELTAQGHGLGASGQEGVGPEVDGASADVPGVDLSPEAIVGLEHDDAGSRGGAGELPCRAQAGDA